MNVDVVVVGSISRDSDSDSYRAERWGGVPTYAGITLARQGLRVCAVSNLAASDRASAIEMLGAAGIECAIGDSDSTTEFVNAYRGGDDRRQTLVSIARPISTGDFKPSLTRISKAGVFILGPVHEQDIEIAVYSAALASPAAVALDVQGLVRPSEIGPIVERVTSTLLQLEISCRFLKLSEHEFDIVAEHYAASAPEIARRWNVDEMLITMGSNGGVVVTGETTLTYAPARTSQASFPTGAGDVMFSSYVALRVFDGLGISEAAHAAALVAGRQVAGEHIDPDELIIGAE